VLLWLRVSKQWRLRDLFLCQSSVFDKRRLLLWILLRGKLVPVLRFGWRILHLRFTMLQPWAMLQFSMRFLFAQWSDLQHRLDVLQRKLLGWRVCGGLPRKRELLQYWVTMLQRELFRRSLRVRLPRSRQLVLNRLPVLQRNLLLRHMQRYRQLYSERQHLYVERAVLQQPLRQYVHAVISFRRSGS
jgi:hypothetical protein